MRRIHQLYRSSLTLLTDLYQLTMAYGYWKSQTSDKDAVFNLFFRKPPFAGGFAVSCGLTSAIDYLLDFGFKDDDIDYLSSLAGDDHEPLFERSFLDYLKQLEFTCDVDAIPEGIPVFAQEPLIRIKGPIVQCQILETALLNIFNFQTLIATKAARIRQAAGDNPVLEFGTRRAQGIDGSLTASWAAYIGGCNATSNVLAGKLYGIPVKGTHAHSWVMSFDSELEAFKEYAKAMPNNCLFLVDTYDTLTGVKHAIEVGRWLKDNNHRLLGIRLDSGDLAYLSIEARKLLDEAGFTDTIIVASNDLDEHIITSLNIQGAAVSAWGVGTKLVTAFDQPAIGGVYKLTAVRSPGHPWRYCLKLSEQAIKISTPGIQQVRRFFVDGQYVGDAIYDELQPPSESCIIIDPLDMTRRKTIASGTPFKDLLVPIFRQGKLVYACPPAAEIKRTAEQDLKCFHSGIRRLLNPHTYPVGLEQKLHELRTSLILEARGVQR